jgi:hypothetical protein
LYAIVTMPQYYCVAVGSQTAAAPVLPIQPQPAYLYRLRLLAEGTGLLIACTLC